MAQEQVSRQSAHGARDSVRRLLADGRDGRERPREEECRRQDGPDAAGNPPRWQSRRGVPNARYQTGVPERLGGPAGPAALGSRMGHCRDVGQGASAGSRSLAARGSIGHPRPLPSRHDQRASHRNWPGQGSLRPPRMQAPSPPRQTASGCCEASGWRRGQT